MVQNIEAETDQIEEDKPVFEENSPFVDFDDFDEIDLEKVIKTKDDTEDTKNEVSIRWPFFNQEKVCNNSIKVEKYPVIAVGPERKAGQSMQCRTSQNEISPDAPIAIIQVEITSIDIQGDRVVQEGAFEENSKVD